MSFPTEKIRLELFKTNVAAVAPGLGWGGWGGWGQRRWTLITSSHKFDPRVLRSPEVPDVPNQLSRDDVAPPPTTTCIHPAQQGCPPPPPHIHSDKEAILPIFLGYIYVISRAGGASLASDPLLREQPRTGGCFTLSETS